MIDSRLPTEVRRLYKKKNPPLRFKRCVRYVRTRQNRIRTIRKRGMPFAVAVCADRSYSVMCVGTAIVRYRCYVQVVRNRNETRQHRRGLSWLQRANITFVVATVTVVAHGSIIFNGYWFAVFRHQQGTPYERPEGWSSRKKIIRFHSGNRMFPGRRNPCSPSRITRFGLFKPPRARLSNNETVRRYDYSFQE